MKNLLTLAAGSLAALGMATSANAAVQASDTMNVTITVAAACTVVAPDMDFGTHATLPAANPTAQVTVVVNCTNGQAYNLTADVGQNVDGAGLRNMSDGGTEVVQYDLFDNNSGLSWGDQGFAGTYNFPSIGSTGTGADQNWVIDGLAVSATMTAIGSYSDVVAVQVEF